MIVVVIVFLEAALVVTVIAAAAVVPHMPVSIPSHFALGPRNTGSSQSRSGVSLDV